MQRRTAAVPAATAEDSELLASQERRAVVEARRRRRAVQRRLRDAQCAARLGEVVARGLEQIDRAERHAALARGC
jgi:hypothetical protein